ncbi:hypothetical protein BD410DRAFT_895311 [Rickenella mellea]|uniref:Uncharacterized protein n=1 Tax=Rickenella mellea TaxID=50990 RepID=A0A4Y7QGB8_9AGAM|nr:hypothetical protein BD410DRAFT_895311 [Rickenella mellea]
MSSSNHTPKLGRSRSFTGGTRRTVSFPNLYCEVPLATSWKSDPTGFGVSRVPFDTADASPQSEPGGVSWRYHNGIARKSGSMPELTTQGVIHPVREPDADPIPIKVENPSYIPDSASQTPISSSFPTHALPEHSPFRDHRLLERLQLARYGPNVINGEVIVSLADSIACYVGNNYQRCETFVTLMEVFCRFLESRNGVGETRIADVVEVLRGTSGWPFDLGDDEVAQAWQLIYPFINFPTDTAPITTSCSTIEEQIRTIFHPTPPHATPVKFKTTLSDILRAGLTVKPTSFFSEHLQIEKDDNDDVTVRFGCEVSPFFFHNFNAHADWEKSSTHGYMDGWAKEAIASTFTLFGNKFYDKTAHDLNLLDATGPEEFNVMKTLFREFKDTPPKLLAHRALELENLVRSRRAFWPTLRRDLRRQRKEQPFAFWGSILALFFGICTVIQTVASVWALVAAVQGNNPQASQTIPGNVVNGMRILGSPWLTCMSNEQLIAATKENATISRLLQIGIQ